MADVAQLVRAPDCGSGGRRFETGRPPHVFLGLRDFATNQLAFRSTYVLQE